MAEATPESGPPQIPSAESFRGTPIKIISVFSFKGGVGKTTVCANMAAMIASASIRVLVIDGDPQGNLSSFFLKTASEDMTMLMTMLMKMIRRGSR